MDYTGSEGLAFLKHFAALCCYPHVFGLAALESPVPVTACVELCSLFVARRVLTSRQCFSCCRAVLQSIKTVPPTPEVSRLGVDKRLGEDTARAADPN